MDLWSHGKSIINGGFNGKIIYKWAIFHISIDLRYHLVMTNIAMENPL